MSKYDHTMRVNQTPVERMEGWELADALGELQSQIGYLKDREGQLKGELIDRGQDVEGEVWAVTLSDVNRNQVNWKLIADKLGASRQIVTAHTRRQSYTAVRVYELED